MKHVKESTTSDKKLIKILKTRQKTSKVQRRQWKSLKKWKKIIRSNNYSILWLAHQQVQIFEKYELNDNFMK